MGLAIDDMVLALELADKDVFEMAVLVDGTDTLELLPVVDRATVVLSVLPVLDNELSFCADEPPGMTEVPEIALNSWHSVEVTVIAIQ